MRITGGMYKGRVLSTPSIVLPGFRPTAEKTREAIFSTLYSMCDISGRHVLDLFSGTGAFAFESLSRGAASAYSLEKNKVCTTYIRRASDELGVSDRITVQCDSFETHVLPSTHQFGLVFADPPYGTTDMHAVFKKIRCALKPNAVVVYEEKFSILQDIVHGVQEDYTLQKVKKYGVTGVAYFTLKETDEQASV